MSFGVTFLSMLVKKLCIHWNIYLFSQFWEVSLSEKYVEPDLFDYVIPFQQEVADEIHVWTDSTK